MLKQPVALPQSISVSADYKILNGMKRAHTEHSLMLYRIFVMSTPNSIIGIANTISYTVYTYIYIILLPEWH